MLAELAAAALVAWGNAWLSGHIGLDEAVDAVERRTGPHTVGATEAAGAEFDAEAPLRATLARLRSHGLASLWLCLPVPGDPLGLVGGAEFNMAAIDAREAVLLRLSGRQVGLVPAEDRRGSSYVGVHWTPYPARDALPEAIPLPDAEHELARAIRKCTPLFDEIGGATDWGPEVTRALADLRDASRAPGTGLPAGYPARAHRVAALADRLAVVVGLADTPGDRGLNSSEIASHAAALRVLDRAVRRARVAAYSALAG